MPQYVFECPKCEKKTEHSFSIAELDRKVVICKECRKHMKRIIAPTNFALAGKGWARDGYSYAPDEFDKHYEKHGKF
jgi:putative FmdB family regulatory protein